MGEVLEPCGLSPVPGNIEALLPWSGIIMVLTIVGIIVPPFHFLGQVKLVVTRFIN